MATTCFKYHTPSFVRNNEKGENMNPNEKPPTDPINMFPLFTTASPSSAPTSSLADYQDHNDNALGLAGMTSPNPEAAMMRGEYGSPPPPAYSALPYRDQDFDFAPILHGKVGDVELETIDGKRFLVHRKVLESETVFFHIYYGFVPAWRLTAPAHACANLPPNPHLPNPAPSTLGNASSRTATAPAAPIAAGVAGGEATVGAALNNLLCFPKILGALRGSSPASITQDGMDTHTEAAATTETRAPPALPPKDRIPTAPTPTTSPYTWSVPESASVLLAFLSLIYPLGPITSSRNTLLSSHEITTRVIRAAMGYQSAKALTTARDRLSHWVKDRPVDVYSIASFFKFSDLAKLASQYAVGVPRGQWDPEMVGMMGRTACHRLITLQEDRSRGLRRILTAAGLETDNHSLACPVSCQMEQVWKARCAVLKETVRPDSELVELLDWDLGILQAEGMGCGRCLILLGQAVRKCLIEAKSLPGSV